MRSHAVFRNIFCSALVVSLVTSPLSAATLQVTQGKAQINRGQGFEPVTNTSTVNPGDIVTVQPGGNAQIVYPDGTIQPIEPGGVASVGAGTTAPVPGQQVVTEGQQVVTQAANPEGGPPGGGAGAGGAAGGLGAGGWSGTTLAIGAVAVGVGIGVAVYAAQNQNKGASP